MKKLACLLLFLLLTSTTSWAELGLTTDLNRHLSGDWAPHYRVLERVTREDGQVVKAWYDVELSTSAPAELRALELQLEALLADQVAIPTGQTEIMTSVEVDVSRVFSRITIRQSATELDYYRANARAGFVRGRELEAQREAKQSLGQWKYQVDSKVVTVQSNFADNAPTQTKITSWIGYGPLLVNVLAVIVICLVLTSTVFLGFFAQVKTKLERLAEKINELIQAASQSATEFDQRLTALEEKVELAEAEEPHFPNLRVVNGQNGNPGLPFMVPDQPQRQGLKNLPAWISKKSGPPPDQPTEAPGLTEAEGLPIE